MDTEDATKALFLYLNDGNLVPFNLSSSQDGSAMTLSSSSQTGGEEEAVVGEVSSVAKREGSEIPLADGERNTVGYPLQ